jgi:sugar (glycoside-pentoside-hexuronide) transporter
MATMGTPGPERSAAGAERLSVVEKIVYGLGDHSLNVSHSALSLLFVFYLTTHVGLRPALAGAIPLIGRAVDAFTDPLMGQISDRTSWRGERRRPYFLAGAVPFGLTFTLLWLDVGMQSQWALFAYYAGAYVVYSLTSTMLSVPYIAILPEMVADYQERTSVNSYRAGLSVAGTLVAATAMRPLSEAFGGGGSGFFWAACTLGAWLALPWIGVFAVTRERPERGERSPEGFFQSLLALLRHRSYRILSGLYIAGRIAMDLVAMMIIYFVSYWLRRPDDFELILGTMMVCSVLSLPVWLHVSRGRDKRTIFIAGCLIWLAVQPVMLWITPEWPRLAIVGIAIVTAVGYAAADMLPWSMLPDVIDEDEYRTGERREGLYAGSFTFFRKIGGAVGVGIAGLVLDASGFVGGAEQSPEAVQSIRWLTALGPAVCLMLAVALASRYTLSRATHARIRDALAERRDVA